MTPSQTNPQLAKALIRAAVIEAFTLFVALYFFISFTDPAAITNLGLPLMFEGQTNLLVGIGLVILGALPVLNVVLAAREKDRM